jgi:MFS transporter, FHS family, L-fucose permease
MSEAKLLNDVTGKQQRSYLVPLFCYIYVLYYGFYGYKINKSLSI